MVWHEPTTIKLDMFQYNRVNIVETNSSHDACGLDIEIWTIEVGEINGDTHVVFNGYLHGLTHGNRRVVFLNHWHIIVSLLVEL